MGTRSTEILLTAIAPAIWGSTYLVTTEFLPAGYPVTVAMLRALPAGLLLLLVVRQMPTVCGWRAVSCSARSTSRSFKRCFSYPPTGCPAV